MKLPNQYTDEEWNALSAIDKAIVWAGFISALEPARQRAKALSDLSEVEREIAKALDSIVANADRARRELIERAKREPATTRG